MKRILVSAILLAATVQPALAQSRVDQAMTDSAQTRGQQIALTSQKIGMELALLDQLQHELDAAKANNPGARAANYIKKASILTAAAGLAGVVHGFMHMKGDVIILPGVEALYGTLGLLGSGAVAGVAEIAEVKLTSDDVTILSGKVSEAKRELRNLRNNLDQLTK